MNMANSDIYRDDELDSEWARYIASLNQKNDLISRKNREKKKIEERERETMINLQRHVRGLSRARIELEDAAIDSFDDSSSDTGTVNILDTPISDKLNDFNSDSDADDIAPTPTESMQSMQSMNCLKPRQQNTKTVMVKPINTVLNILSGDDINDSNDSQDSDINDSHSLESTTNCSQDSRDTDSDNDDDSESKSSTKSNHNSNDSNDSNDSLRMEDEISDLQYDKELEALKQELHQFKRRNFNRLRRTKSQEEILLSVLNIDGKDIDAKQLEKCTKKAINKYNSMTQREKKRRMERKKSQNDINDIMGFGKKRSLNKRDKLLQYPSSPIIMTPIPESPMPGNNELNKLNKLNSLKHKHNKHSKSGKKPRKQLKKKKKKRKLADPYNEEWNGLDPDDYIWYDDVPEGECYDDNELSLRNRRIQYLVVMAIENHYCTISDLTYKQNELLLLYQQSLIF